MDEAGVNRERLKETAPRYPIGHWWGGAGEGWLFVASTDTLLQQQNTRDAAQTETGHHISQPIHPLITTTFLQALPYVGMGPPCTRVPGGFEQ